MAATSRAIAILTEQQPAVAGLDAGRTTSRGCARRGRCRWRRPPAAARRRGVEKRASVVAASDLAAGERPQRHHQPDETAEPRRTRHQVEDVGRDQQRASGAKARVCPTRDGPASASTAPPASSQRRVAVRRRGRGRPRRDAQPEQHQQGAQQLVADQAGVERRHDVRELEALAVDRRDGDLQDDAGGARRGGVPRAGGAAGHASRCRPRCGGGPGRGRSQDPPRAAARRR